MMYITKITFLLASAAFLVSAGPLADPEAAPEAAPLAEIEEGLSHYDSRSIVWEEDPRLQERNGNLFCGNMATASYFDAHSLVLSMNFAKDDRHTAPAHGCRRTHCKNTSGLYVCNDRNSDFAFTNGDVLGHLDNILQKCCIHNRYGSNDGQQQSGGQQFTDALGGGWNAIIAYANCNHPDTRIPSTYNGGTVNGPGCRPAVMYLG